MSADNAPRAGGGLQGAIMLTVGIFLPAFAFPPLGHGFFERVLHQPRVRRVIAGRGRAGGAARPGGVSQSLFTSQ